MTWVCLLSPAFDRAFLAGADEKTRAVFQAHGDHLDAMRAGGSLVLAGRCWDGPYGIVIFEAVDRPAAEAVVASDPSVMAGVQRADLYEFNMPYPPVGAWIRG